MGNPHGLRGIAQSRADISRKSADMCYKPDLSKLFPHSDFGGDA